MPTYVALLRGINVSGHKLVKMERLRTLFESLNFAEVKTYIQSGNVIFKSVKRTCSSLSQRIAEAVFADFGFPVHVLVKTAEELSQIISKNPFLNDNGVDQSKLHVTFLDKPAPASAATILGELCAAAERFYVSGREIYLYCPAGYGNSKLSSPIMEKKLSIQGTTRNWKTVNALYVLTQ